MSIKIAPSILSADPLNLESEINTVKGCDFLHIDIMDGHFVPNITYGPDLVKHLSKLGIPLDVHLMISDPDKYIKTFAEAGSHYLTIHAEAPVHLHRSLNAIREAGAKPGVSLNPATPLNIIRYVLTEVDLVLIMTVNPGYGGQKFIPSMLDKISELSEMISKLPQSSRPLIEVDGGVSAANAKVITEAGANILVAGSAVFGQNDRQKAILNIKNAI